MDNEKILSVDGASTPVGSLGCSGALAVQAVSDVRDASSPWPPGCVESDVGLRP